MGHETDFTIADFVADLRAPTPSAAMEIALPDIKELLHKFENVRSRISLSLSKRLDGEKRLLKMLASSAVLTTPERLYQDKMLELSRLSENLEDAVTVAVADRAKNITSLSSLLNSYNPLGVLKRGYSVAFDGEGKIISAANQIDIGEGFTLKLSDGSISAVRTGEEYGKKTYEEAVKRLEEIVKALEEARPLEESIKLFEEGAKLVKMCEKMLSEAEQKVKILISGREEDFGGENA